MTYLTLPKIQNEEIRPIFNITRVHYKRTRMCNYAVWVDTLISHTAYLGLNT